MVKKRLISAEEFFQDKIELASNLKNKSFKDEEVEDLLKFISFDKVNVEGRDLVLFTQEDKKMLFENFPEIKKSFDGMNFGDFGDRKQDEARFWNDFFKKQAELNTFLYGDSMDEKTKRRNLPDFIKEKVDNMPIDNHMNVFDNIEDITNDKNNEGLLSNKINSKGLIGEINNLSISILYKNIDEPTNIEKIKINEPAIDQEEFDIVKFESQETVKQAITPVQRRNSLNRLNQSRTKRFPEKAFKQYQKCIQNFTTSIREKTRNGTMADYFCMGEKSPHLELLKVMDKQVKNVEEINKDQNQDEKAVFNEKFLDRYKNFNTRIHLLLKTFYSQFPVNRVDDRDNIKTTLQQLASEEKELSNFNHSLGNYDFNKHEMEFYRNSLIILERQIKRAKKKVGV